MTPSEAVETCLKKYASFGGRASQAEYWYFILFVCFTILVGGFFSETLGAIVSLVTLVPCFAVTSRRLHDIGKSGWWQLIGLVPIIGWLIMIYWCLKDSADDNEYGDASR